MRAYDDRRWIKNEDGSFTRKPPEGPDQVPQPVDVNAGGDEHDVEPGDAYYKDITTTGAAAELAAELDVDLGKITGTGLHGKITKADVEKAAAGN